MGFFACWPLQLQLKSVPVSRMLPLRNVGHYSCINSISAGNDRMSNKKGCPPHPCFIINTLPYLRKGGADVRSQARVRVPEVERLLHRTPNRNLWPTLCCINKKAFAFWAKVSATCDCQLSMRFTKEGMLALIMRKMKLLNNMPNACHRLSDSNTAGIPSVESKSRKVINFDIPRHNVPSITLKPEQNMKVKYGIVLVKASCSLCSMVYLVAWKLKLSLQVLTILAK